MIFSGEPGAPGPAGAIGQKGEPGYDGIPGAAGVKGEQGTVTVIFSLHGMKMHRHRLHNSSWERCVLALSALDETLESIVSIGALQYDALQYDHLDEQLYLINVILKEFLSQKLVIL